MGVGGGGGGYFQCWLSPDLFFQVVVVLRFDGTVNI